MEERLYISDVIMKYQGKLPLNDIKRIILKYDELCSVRIKQRPENREMLEKEMVLVMDSELEKLLTI